MKRTIVIFVLIIIVISVAATTGNAIIIAETVPAKECAQSSAIDYLEQAAYSQYFYEETNLDYYTIAGVPEEKKQELKKSMNASDLLGAVLLVKSGTNAYRHALIITQVLGSTRNTVYYTAYNSCKRNVLLSINYGTDSNGVEHEYDKIYVMAPKYLRGGNQIGSNYCYAYLKPALALNTTSVIKARTVSSVATISMEIYAPGASIPSYTYSANNNYVLYSASINFNQTGLWRVKVSGSNLNDYTFTIRVAPQSQLGNG